MANLSPLAGVAFLGWDADTLAFVYTVAVVFGMAFAGVKALFARQPPAYDDLESDPDEQTLDDTGETAPTGPSDLDRRRGSVRVAAWLPPVYPRNVPFVADWFLVTLVFAALLPAFLARVVDPLGEFVGPATALCVASLILSQVVGARQQYFRRRQYETVSPRAVVQVPIQEAAVVLGVVAVAGAGLTATGFVVAAVVVETLVDCGQYRDGGLFGYFTVPSVDRSLRAVDVPDAPATAEIRPDRRAVLANGVLAGAQKALAVAPLYLFFWLGVLILSDGAPVSLAAVTVLSFVVAPLIVAALETAEYALTHGWMTYRRHGGTVVGYDELTDTAQWATPVGAFRRAALADGRLADRLFDTQTLAVTPTGADEGLCLAHVRSAARAAGVFELPLTATEYEPFRSRFAAVVAALTAVTVAAEVAVAFTVPGEVRGTLLVVLLPFLVPATVFGFRRLWRRAY